MPPAPRKQPNTTNHPRTPRKRAPGALQRRLRHIGGSIEWVDVIAGALLGQLLDAVGGEGGQDHFHDLLHTLLELL